MPDKYQDEIEEILKRAGEVAPKESRRESERPPEDQPRALQERRHPNSGGSGRRRRLTITPGKILIVGLVLFLISLVVKLPILVWVGLGLLALGYLLYFMSPKSAPSDKRWRGMPVGEVDSSPWERVKRWLKGAPR